MKNILLSFFLFILVLNSRAQESSKDVTITASGSGASMEEAQRSALRSATEQAFGAFISSKTEIFNDQIVADEISSVSSGNIKSYDVLNQAQLPDGRYGITVKAIVSVDKLTSFVQAKGIEIEIKGGLFAMNIKQQLLNEEGEVQAVAQIVGLLHETMQTAFDYSIQNGDPISLDTESKNWRIPLSITATCNSNMEFCINYFTKTLAAISLTPAEAETYRTLNKNVYNVSINSKLISKNIHLRRETSLNIIKSFIGNWKFYTRLFEAKAGIDAILFNGKESISVLASSVNGDVSISFPSNGENAAIFTWSDNRTLEQIEQMTGYSVKPRGVISHFKLGGYVVYEKEGHGLVMAVCDLGKMQWLDAKKKCKDLVINGYGNWSLPSIDELESINKECLIKGIGGITNSEYWSWISSYDDDNKAMTFNFGSPRITHRPKDDIFNVRAVHSF